MVKTYILVVNNLSRALAVLATLLLIAAMLVVCQMIAIRYILRMATIWQTDFVVFSATAAIFLGAPYVLLKGGHVGVDIVEMMVGEKTRRGLRIVASFLGLLFCMAMLVASWIHFHDAWAGNWKHSSVWAPPLWIPLAALPIGFGMLCLQYIAEILKLFVDAGAAEPAKPAEVGALGQVPAAHTLRENPR